jgi:hypothetical protein
LSIVDGQDGEAQETSGEQEEPQGVQGPEISGQRQKTYLTPHAVTKNDLNKPPNLAQFKSRMIQSLKSKQANRDETIGNLEREKVPDIQRLME